MRLPEEILEAIHRRYQSKWRDWLEDPHAGPFTFPLDAPGPAVIAGQQDQVRSWLLAWRAWGQAHPEVSLRQATRKVAFGVQDVYTHLDIPDAATLASLYEADSAHWMRAHGRYSQLVVAGASPRGFRPQLARIIELDEYDFALLLRVSGWFAAHPRSGLTIRQVPVEGLHTKWLAKHRSLVTATLDLATPDMPEAAGDEDVDPATLDALGLKPLPSHIDLILADPDHRRLVSGIRHLRVPVEEAAALPLTPTTVLIVENKESALPVSDHAGLVIIHSLGNFLDALIAIPWMPKRVLYWGDLDRAGFTLLSRARTRVPRLRSILMDRATLQHHRDLANLDPTFRTDPPDPTLTVEEGLALSELISGASPLRLEQERIPWASVVPLLESEGLARQPPESPPWTPTAAAARTP